MHKKEFIVEVNSADDEDIFICQLPKDLLPPIPVEEELVRCKDCKYYDSEHEVCCVYVSYRFTKDADDYCSDAERKEQ